MVGAEKEEKLQILTDFNFFETFGFFGRPKNLRVKTELERQNHHQQIIGQTK